MSIIVVDTETSTIAKPQLAYDHPTQPYLMELGAILADDDGTERAVLSCYLHIPPETEVHPKAFEAHGLTVETVNKHGLPPLVALSVLTHMWASADTLCAFNLPFDLRIINIAIARTGRPSLLPRPARAVCAMELATPVLNLPPTPRMLEYGFTGPKRPNLQEAHTALLGAPFEGAHGALADCRATLRVYLELIRRQNDGQHL